MIAPNIFEEFKKHYRPFLYPWKFCRSNEILEMKNCFHFFFSLLITGCVSAQERFSVLITEIMADPSPSIGFPEYEWIEIKNVSSQPINMKQWRLGDGNGFSGQFPDFILLPDSILILCGNSAASHMSLYGRVISITGFPSLDNTGEQLYLQNNFGKIIHSLEYSLSWYGNKLKEGGSWSLEMIDTGNPCHSSNWKASISSSGGTPGEINSVNNFNPDQESPRVINVFITDPSNVILVFDEPLDSLSGATTGNYLINGSLNITATTCIAPLFRHVHLKLSGPLQQEEILSITVASVKDCSNNSISQANTIKIAIPSIPGKGDIVINEILFNPRPAGHDYAEFYNAGNKVVDAGKMHIANRSTSGDISNIKPISTKPLYIFPGEYFVVTENVANLSLQYLVKDVNKVLPVLLPSLPDDEGTLVLLNEQGEIIDEIKYSDDWHFKLIENKEGISLERIDVKDKTQEQKNWHSAASTAGYGTPGYKNSQYKSIDEPHGSFILSPKILSPDNDGYNDFITIAYEMQSPGFMVTITIFDAAGRVVKNLVRNELAGIKGHWNWDGLGEQGVRLPVGIYVLHADMFDLNGKRSRIKKTLVIASK